MAQHLAQQQYVVLPQRDQFSFDCRGLGVRCCEPHPSLNCCASVASPFISSCRRQNACVTSFSFLCALLRTTQETMIVLHTCDKKRIFQILAAFIFYLKSTFSALALECEGSSGKCEVWSVKEAVGSEKCEVWSVKFKFGVRSAQCEVWGLECEGSSGKCEVWSAKCELWSVECEVSSSECEECSVKCGVWRLCFVSRWKNQTVVEVWSAKRAVWSVRFGVWRKQWEVRSVKCEVCEVLECEVSSSECEECSVKCGVWRLCFVSRWKNQTVVEGRTRSGQGVFEL